MSIRFTRDEHGKKKLKKKIQQKCHGKNKEALERLLADLEKIKEEQDRLRLLSDLDRFGDDLFGGELSEEAVIDPEKLLRQSEI